MLVFTKNILIDSNYGEEYSLEKIRKINYFIYICRTSLLFIQLISTIKKASINIPQLSGKLIRGLRCND